MKNYLETLSKVSLFKKIQINDLDTMLTCLGPTVRSYKKNETIFSINDKHPNIGVVLCGAIHISKDDIMGNHMIISDMGKCDIFGEAITCAQKERMPFDVTASQNSEILFLNYSKILTTCTSSCSFHKKLIENLLFTIANKNLVLNEKIEIISKRTTREKVMHYLNTQARKTESSTFSIPFNRQEMADYLCVERSALSTELSKLQTEGFLSFKKNIFTLLFHE